jgi:hypothetical protein
MSVIRTPEKRRGALALTALVLVSYLAVGHGFHAASSAGMAMDDESICLVLVILGTAAVAVAVRPRLSPPRLPLAVVLPLPAPAAAGLRAPRGARASPRWLQRFLR